MLHKKLGEKIAETIHYHEFRAPRQSAPGHYTTFAVACQEKFFRHFAQKFG
jgi:hypothetical protein